MNKNKKPTKNETDENNIIYEPGDFFQTFCYLWLTVNIFIILCAMGFLIFGIYFLVYGLSLDQIFREKSIVVKDFDNGLKGSMNKQKNALTLIIQIPFFILIGFCVIIIVSSIFGIVVYKTLKKRQKKVINSYLAFIFITIILLIFPSVMLCSPGIITNLFKDEMFQIFIGDKGKQFNALSMAVLQSNMICCGVNGAEDYFCTNIYDYECNRGCTLPVKQWKTMAKKVEKTLNVPVCPKSNRKPINASKTAMCRKPISEAGDKRYLVLDDSSPQKAIDSMFINRGGCATVLLNKASLTNRMMNLCIVFIVLIIVHIFCFAMAVWAKRTFQIVLQTDQGSYITNPSYGTTDKSMSSLWKGHITDSDAYYTGEIHDLPDNFFVGVKR